MVHCTARPQLHFHQVVKVSVTTEVDNKQKKQMALILLASFVCLTILTVRTYCTGNNTAKQVRVTNHAITLNNDIELKAETVALHNFIKVFFTQRSIQQANYRESYRTPQRHSHKAELHRRTKHF